MNNEVSGCSSLCWYPLNHLSQKAFITGPIWCWCYFFHCRSWRRPASPGTKTSGHCAGRLATTPRRTANESTRLLHWRVREGGKPKRWTTGILGKLSHLSTYEYTLTTHYQTCWTYWLVHFVINSSSINISHLLEQVTFHDLKEKRQVNWKKYTIRTGQVLNVIGGGLQTEGNLRGVVCLLWMHCLVLGWNGYGQVADPNH